MVWNVSWPPTSWENEGCGCVTRSLVSCPSKARVRRSRHRMFTGLTSEHGQNCRAIVPNPWWTVGRRTYGAAQEESRPPAPRSRGGLIRARGNSCAVARPAQRRHPSAQYERRLHLGPPARTTAEFHLRTVDRSAHAAGGHHADVRQGHRRARRPERTGDSLRDEVDRGAVSDPAAFLR